MKTLHFPNFLLILLVLICAFSVRAQNEQMNETPPNEIQRPVDKRPNLLRELGLSREQLQSIRRLNAERKFQKQEAQRNLAEARQNLDAAIYADNVSDSEIQARLKDFQTAQAEAANIRVTTELEIRKLLTPEQVIKFRQLRENFQNRLKAQRPNLRGNQFNRFRNRRNAPIPKN
jgi:Spy/CpxP family protein refolding chaperone